MRKFLIALLAAATVSIGGFASQAKAMTAPVDGGTSAYCYGYEAGRVAQDSHGYWYRCSFTGQGPTGWQWWRIG